MSIILFPIFLPPGMEVLSTWRVLVAVALFAAAYLAENIRGGLQSIPKGQYEAADALGLGTARKYRLIIMPQALRAVIPAIVGQFIGLFKDTTLIETVGLIEFLALPTSSRPNKTGLACDASLCLYCNRLFRHQFHDGNLQPPPGATSRGGRALDSCPTD